MSETGFSCPNIISGLSQIIKKTLFVANFLCSAQIFGKKRAKNECFVLFLESFDLKILLFVHILPSKLVLKSSAERF